MRVDLFQQLEKGKGRKGESRKVEIGMGASFQYDSQEILFDNVR
jgi:hypothetical protein